MYVASERQHKQSTETEKAKNTRLECEGPARSVICFQDSVCVLHFMVKNALHDLHICLCQNEPLISDSRQYLLNAV